jgi:LuxR family maltose regulon positive regulatory protein
LVEARLQRPEPSPRSLERPRLLQALAEHADRPLRLVVGEAGFGKTTLCAAYVRAAGTPCVWYSLRPSDGDLAVFGRYLLAGVRRHFPRFGRPFERALQELKAGVRPAEMLAGTFVNELATLKGPRLLLMLDDFHDVLSSPAVIAFTETMLGSLPVNVRVLIASRTPPPVGIERLRARASVFELQSAQLRFTRDELSRLFGEVYGIELENDDLTALDETTLGWPTAVHLVHESLRRGDDATLGGILRSFRSSHLELRSYLSNEVLALLEPDARRLIERTAALSRFDLALAEAMVSEPVKLQVLDGLVQRGLLRAFGGGEQVSWECHELVRDFVRQDLESRLGVAGWRALESDTAEALKGRGEIEGAYRHLVRAQSFAEAAELLRGIAPELLRHGRAGTAKAYLGDLPDELMRGDLELALCAADAAQALGTWDEAEKLYAAVLERCRTGTATGGHDVRAVECRVLVGLGRILNSRGQHEQVLGMCERGLAMARSLDAEARARLMQLKAGAHFYLGQFRSAMTVLDQVREEIRGLDIRELQVTTQHNLAVALASQGHFREALREFRVALAQVSGSDSPRAPLYLMNLAFLHADLGELAESRRAAQDGLAAAQRFANPAHECMCQQALARALAEGGDLDGAIAALRRAEELDAQLRIEIMAADLLALRARIFCARGEYRRAVEFMTQAIARSGERAGAPRLLEFEALLGWCELRAGRMRVARDRLAPLVARADASDNDAQRMSVHYWLGEALLGLGERRTAEPHLALALKLTRERGYEHFLRTQVREEPAPLLHAIGRGLEVDTAASALVVAGSSVERPLLELLPGADPEVAEAVLSVLTETGSAASLEALDQLAQRRRSLATACRRARTNISERVERGRLERAAVGTRSYRLLLFGPPRLEADGNLLPAHSWRTQRAFQLLVYLALRPRGASRDDLLERFWPRQLAAGRRNFHPTLSYIRHVLAGPKEAPILREGELYRLNPAFPLACDAWEFERSLAHAGSARNAKEREAAVGAALATSTGPFLEGWYSDWADEEQVRVRERLEKALLEWGEFKAGAAEFAEALAAFRRATELDAYRESTRLAAIECLIRLGTRREAMVEYEKLKTLLRRELGVDPLPETEEAIERLLRGEGVHGWPGAPESEGVQRVAASAQVPLKRRLGV